MKHRSLLALALLLLCSCRPARVDVADNVCILPDTIAATATITADQLRFVGADHGVAGTCRVGDVVISGYGHGFLRTISAITTSGDTLVFDTKQADLTDAIKNGSAHWTLPVGKPPPAAPLSPKGVAHRTEALTGGDDLTSGIDVTGATLYSDATTTITVTHGRIRLDASASVDADIANNSLQRFALTTAGNLDADLAIKIDSTKPITVDRDVEVWSGSQLFFQLLGPVPVVIVAEVSVSAGASASLDCGVSTEIGTHVSGSVSGGVAYDGSDWSSDGTSALLADAIGPTMDRTVNVTLKPYLKIKVGYKFYGLVGPFTELQPYASFTAQLSPDAQWTLHGGASATVGFETATIPFPLERPGWLWSKLKGLIDKLSARSVSTELFSWDKLVASETLGMTGTIGCGFDGGTDMPPRDLANADLLSQDLAGADLEPPDLAMPDLEPPDLGMGDLKMPPESCGHVRVSGQAFATWGTIPLPNVAACSLASHVATADHEPLPFHTRAVAPYGMVSQLDAHEVSPGVVSVEGLFGIDGSAAAVPSSDGHGLCYPSEWAQFSIEFDTTQAGSVRVDIDPAFATSLGLGGFVSRNVWGEPPGFCGGTYSVNVTGDVTAGHWWYCPHNVFCTETCPAASDVGTATLPAGHHAIYATVAPQRLLAMGAGRLLTLTFPCSTDDGGVVDQSVPEDLVTPPDQASADQAIVDQAKSDQAILSCPLGDGFALPPTMCQTGTDPVSGSPYVVCNADCNNAWISATGSGVGATYRAQTICNQLGYANLYAFGKQCGSICGSCGSPASCISPGMMLFDSDPSVWSNPSGTVILLGNEVTWRCSNGPPS